MQKFIRTFSRTDLYFSCMFGKTPYTPVSEYNENAVTSSLQADASIFHVAVGKAAASRSTLTIEQVTALSGSDTRQGRGRPPPVQKMG